MEKILCKDCGSEMDSIELRMADINIEEGELYVEESYECSECECRETFGFTGNVISVERWNKR